MIHSFAIKNFRCFASVKASDLGRINLVVGDNRSGKTALLEALFLVCGNSPENHLKIRGWRGLGGDIVRLSSSEFSSGALWRDLFFGFQSSAVLKIDVRGTISRSLSIDLREPVLVSVPLKGSDLLAPVVFTWRDAKGKASKSVPRWSENEGLQLPIVPVGVPGAMLGPVSAREIARLFSDLDKRNRAEPVVEGLQIHFSDIQSLSVQTDEAVGHVLYAQLASMSEKIPVPFISSGINRLLAMLIHIETYPKGVVFIDEIENGMYFKRLPEMWKVINEASRRRGTQLFASTHSQEALTSLLSVMKGNESDFRLIRVTRDDEGRSHVRVIKGGDLEAAIEDRVEVR